jgi:hypothetical protein
LLPPRRIGQALSAIATVAAVILAAPAHALQLVEASDGVSVEAILSIKEPTRIRIENAPITDVFGNILSSNCGPSPALPTNSGITAPGVGMPAINPGGEIVLECDRDKGEIYIRPVGDSAKPVNLFVSSADATYTLLLRRADTPADTIVIRDKTPKAFRATGANQVAAGPSPNPIRAMKAPVAMASIACRRTSRWKGAPRYPAWTGASPWYASTRGAVSSARSSCCRTSAPNPWWWRSRSLIATAARSPASPSSTTTCAPARAPAST